MAKLTINGVSKCFGTVHAVDDFTLTVNSGELCFLLGPSGCGKTTVLRLIAGFLAADLGAIFFDDKDVSRVPAHARNIGMMFQSYALWPHMSVAQNLSFGLELRKVPTAQRLQRVKRALEMVRAGELLERYPGELSGGQQQRVALARALVLEPQIVLLDEPLSNVDAKLRFDMRGEIKRLHKELGLTMVYVTHDQQEALALADTVVVMRAGKIAQSGPPRQVYQHPASRFVAEFIGEANIIDGKVTALGRDIAVETPIGTLLSSLPYPGLKVGSAVQCLIRPERLALEMRPRGDTNCFSAVVTQCAYLGSHAQINLRCAGNLELRVNDYSAAGTQLSAGASVGFKVSPADVALLSIEAR